MRRPKRTSAAAARRHFRPGGNACRPATLAAAGAVLLLGLLAMTGLPERPAEEAYVTPPSALAEAGPSFVIRARALYPVTSEQPGPIERGMVVVRDGRIVAVGRDLDIPPDLPLIELRDEVVCPGLVSAGASLAGQHAGPHSVRGGLSNEDALETITIDAARILGVDDRVGSLEVGKDADLIVCDGDLLHYMTQVHYTIVNGRVVYDKSKDTLYAHIRPEGKPEVPDFDDQWPRRLEWPK